MSRVGADAGIAEQVPGAADAVAALENGEALAGALLLQVIARADAGQPGADDQDVEMFCCHDGLRARVSGADCDQLASKPIKNATDKRKPRIAPGLRYFAASFRSGPKDRTSGESHRESRIRFALTRAPE